MFPTSFFQEKQARKVCFTIFQNEKTPFQAIKKKSSKSRKIAIFPKGLTHCFGPKIAVYPTTFFQVKEIRKMSFTIFQKKKKAYLGYKDKKFKKSKNCPFSKGVNPQFRSKNGLFSNTFFFRQNRAGKCLLLNSTTKKRLSRL